MSSTFSKQACFESEVRNNVKIESELTEKLKILAEKYENPQFIIADPVQFPHRFTNTNDREVMAFIASSLAFGKRSQILNHIELICKDFEKKSVSPSQWIKEKQYESFFPENDSSFYRVFTNKNLRKMCAVLNSILKENETLGEFFLKEYKKNPEMPLYQTVRKPFCGENKECGSLIPYTKQSCCKRLQLFLRWMVRSDSPVDFGLWQWYDKKNLIMPLDVHVLQESERLGLFGNPGNSLNTKPAATIKTAEKLTAIMSQIWPEDPLKGDYALFGLGVDDKLQ